MFFSKEDNTIITIPEENDLFENAINQALSDNLIPQSNSSCLSYLNSSFSFSDITCCSCLGLVPILGAAGLGLGYAVIKPFFEYMKNNSNMLDNLAFGSPPFIGMILGMVLAFYIWGKSIDWAVDWEVATARGRDPGLVAACKDFFTGSCFTLAQLKIEEEQLIDADGTESLHLVSSV